MLKNTLKYENLEQILDSFRFGDYKFEDNNAMNNWDSYGIVRKDIMNGERLLVNDLLNVTNDSFELLCDNSIIMPCNIKKEKYFFNVLGIEYDLDDLKQWLQTDEAKDWFRSRNIFLNAIVENKNIRGSLVDALADSKKQEFFSEIKNPTTYYEAKIMSKNGGGFIAFVDGLNTFLPGSLASANKIVDFDTLIGKKVNVMIEDYIKEGDTFIVSNKKYIQHILPIRLENLNYDKLYTGTVTGPSKFGLFIEFDDIFTGLLHVSEMDEDIKNKFNEGFYKQGSIIQFYIKEIGKNNRIILSSNKRIEKEGTIEKFKEECNKSFQTGRIINIKQMGSFVEFIYKDEKFVGLLHYKEYPRSFKPEMNMELKLWINDVDVNEKKIFLKWDI